MEELYWNDLLTECCRPVQPLARSRQQDGFGLGLAIVKWIAEAHHAEVEPSRQPGAGSTFTVSFSRR